LTELYLIRHAEAEGNVYRRAHGQYDSLLTPNGRAQLEKLGEWFRQHPVDAVYASDLYRARTTAGAVAGVYGLPVYTDRRLREVHLGDWEDRPWGDIAQREGDALARFNRDMDFTISGGENYEQVFGRFTQAIREIIAAHPGGRVVVVAHGCVLKYYLDSIAGQHPHLDNASTSLVRIVDGASKVIFAGENEYLGELSTFLGQTWWRATGNKDAELWFRPLTLPGQEDEAARYGAACWRDIYGTDEKFDDALFRSSCRDAVAENPRFVQFVMEGDHPIGFFKMGVDGFSEHCGHIGAIFLDKARRGHGLGMQLVGEAVSISRAQGKRGVSLRVWEKNRSAIGLYQKTGFTETGRETGLFGPLLQMTLNIEVP